jgi:hypothetical protein
MEHCPGAVDDYIECDTIKCDEMYFLTISYEVTREF